jgi:hypothetical protein
MRILIPFTKIGRRNFAYYSSRLIEYAYYLLPCDCFKPLASCYLVFIRNVCLLIMRPVRCAGFVRAFIHILSKRFSTFKESLSSFYELFAHFMSFLLFSYCSNADCLTVNRNFISLYPYIKLKQCESLLFLCRNEATGASPHQRQKVQFN